jgi:putative pyruvate formate lyase activating enzyme
MAAAGPPVWEGEAMRRGMIVRHLVLPGQPADTRAVLEFFAGELKEKALLSLMVQYTAPCPGAGPEGRLKPAEYDTIMDWLAELDIEEGFVQDLADATPWLPDFTKDNPFPEGYGEPVWHWRRSDPPA